MLRRLDYATQVSELEKIARLSPRAHVPRPLPELVASAEACLVCGARPARGCALCRSVAYCGIEHQRADARWHDPVCDGLRLVLEDERASRPHADDALAELLARSSRHADMRALAGWDDLLGREDTPPSLVRRMTDLATRPLTLANVVQALGVRPRDGVIAVHVMAASHREVDVPAQIWAEAARLSGSGADFAVVLGLATGASLSFLGELGSENRGSGAQMFRGPVVTLEGALAGAMFTQLVKNIFGVCRPRDWDDTSRTCTTRGEGGNDEGAIDEAHRSFPSGHSAPLAGMAGAALGMYLLPSTPRREQLADALTSLGFAVTVVALRERAGAHSWVDVGAAFITGGLAGFATAALHIRPVDKEATNTAPAPMMFTLGSSF